MLIVRFWDAKHRLRTLSHYIHWASWHSMKYNLVHFVYEQLSTMTISELSKCFADISQISSTTQVKYDDGGSASAHVMYRYLQGDLDKMISKKLMVVCDAEVVDADYVWVLDLTNDKRLLFGQGCDIYLEASLSDVLDLERYRSLWTSEGRWKHGKVLTSKDIAGLWFLPMFDLKRLEYVAPLRRKQPSRACKRIRDDDDEASVVVSDSKRVFKD